MAAVAGGLLLSVSPATVAAGIAAAGTIPGRLEPIPNMRGLHVFVDYAHTPDGMDRVLSTLRGLTEGRLVTVFGCGGNRDRGKRPRMGRVAALRSDVVVVTSDNPRDEDPGAILAEIVPGLTSEGLLEAHGPAAWREGSSAWSPTGKRRSLSPSLSLSRGTRWRSSGKDMRMSRSSGIGACRSTTGKRSGTCLQRGGRMTLPEVIGAIHPLREAGDLPVGTDRGGHRGQP